MDVNLKVVDNNTEYSDLRSAIAAYARQLADSEIAPPDDLATQELSSHQLSSHNCGPHDLSIATLQRAYITTQLTPSAVIDKILVEIEASREENVWISVLHRRRLEDYLSALEQRNPNELPLYGIPFAINDNIDLAGLPTSAACADFSYRPRHSAFVVAKLIEAGAIPIGKTNMDQFATGLAGTRSPFGITRNSIDAQYISGGSSSGAALAVAKGQASFAITTDTTGSTRVPAALNQLVGIKPSRGLSNMSGIVPTIRSLDCLGLLCLNPVDASLLIAQLCNTNTNDPIRDLNDDQREAIIQALGEVQGAIGPFRFGIPQANQLEFFSNDGFRGRFSHVIDKLQSLGGVPTVVDFSPFREAARLLQDGPRLAERYLSVQEMMDNPDVEVLDIVEGIIAQGKADSPTYKASDRFACNYRLKNLQARAARELRQVDFLLTPTVGTCYTVEAMQKNPLVLDANLGFYTHFTNLLNLATVAIPADDAADALPFGVSLAGPAYSDAQLLKYSSAVMSVEPMSMGACGYQWG